MSDDPFGSARWYAIRDRFFRHFGQLLGLVPVLTDTANLN